MPSSHTKKDFTLNVNQNNLNRVPAGFNSGDLRPFKNISRPKLSKFKTAN